MLSVSCTHQSRCVSGTIVGVYLLELFILIMLYCIVYCFISLLQSLLHPLLEHHQLRKTTHSKQQKVKALEACVEEKASIDKLQFCQCQAHLVLADTSGLRVHNVKLLDICIARCSSSMTQNDIYRFTVLTHMLHV